MNNDKYELIITKKDLDILYHNKIFYINNKKYKYEIVEVNRDIISRNNSKYSEVIVSLDKSINEDVIVSYIFYKKRRLIDIFRIIYKSWFYCEFGTFIV